MSSDGSDYMSDLQASSDTKCPSSDWLIKYPHLDHSPWEVADSPDAPRIRPKKASDWSTLSGKDIAIIEGQQLHRKDYFLDEEAFLKLYTSDSTNPFRNMANVPKHVYAAVDCPPVQEIAPKEINIEGPFGTRDVAILKAQYQGKDVLIKPFRPDRDHKAIYGDAHACFIRERIAYEHLLKAGVTDCVPKCYGYVIYPNAWKYTTIKEDIRGLVLEFIPDAEQLSADNVTEDIAERVLRALYQIHRAYVRHDDVQPRNVLVLPDGRVVILDFDRSMCPAPPLGYMPLYQRSLVREMAATWALLYEKLLPYRLVKEHDKVVQT